jgi:hypothetical protein
MKAPKYPIATNEDTAPEKPVQREPPRDLYLMPSFKHRHEVREPLESGEDAYRRAYPHFFAPAPRRGLRRRV